MSRDELIALVEKIMQAQGTEQDMYEWISLLQRSVPHPAVSDLIYWNARHDITPTEVVERALAWRPDAEPNPVEVSAAGRASAERLVGLLVEKNALALRADEPSVELVESVALAIALRASPEARAARLSDVLIDSGEVDELFADAETLTELLKNW